MNINLKPYQEKAVDQLIETAVKLLNFDGPGEALVFQAPTGSGKTIMTAKFIEGLIKELPNDDICFVWMSIGKGELHLQSKHSLEKVFAGFPRVTLAEEEFSGGRERIVKNEVVVANWEKLRSKDSKTGEWKVLLMKDGEKLNFRDVLEKTREQQRKIILIIDESHTNATSERAQELRQIISADLVMEMSATPKLIPTVAQLFETKAGFVKVNSKDVIEEGMIKKELIINEDIEKIAKLEEDSETAVLEASFQKRLELLKAFKKEGSNINPLVLVQIPTAEAGEQKIEAIKKFLASKNITERKDGHGNGKLAVWLAEQKSELIDWISEPNNEIEFLIFKQAIDTGWDCPRAHILVKFRETHNIVFEIQTVGRILRMPEQKHYDNEILNKGYIYTNLLSISVKKEEYNPNIIKHLKATRIKKYKPIKIESYYKARADYGDITSSFVPVFEKTANAYFGITKNGKLKENIKAVENKDINLDIKKYQQELIADTSLDVKSFDQIEGKVNPDAWARLNVATDELQILFEQVIKNNLGSFKNVKRSVPAVKTAIYLWFNNNLDAENWPDPSLLTQKIFLNNKNRIVFEHILSKAISEYVIVKENEVRKRVEESEQKYSFELQNEQFYNEYTDEIIKVKNYAYEPCYLNTDRSNPEREFETFLNTNASKIDWWWKNGENKQDYFGVKYEYQNSIYTFYPDYLVKLTGGRLGLFEVKDAGDRDGKTYTKAKAEALQKYMTGQKNKKLFGGIVIQKNHIWLINDNKIFDWGKCERGNWDEWEVLKL
ncbi:MAG: DEAD/DEAH box helicase family protein [Candidatus Paceibacterota bacterium]